MALSVEERQTIIEKLSAASVLEIAELVKELEEKWGVSAAAPVAVAAAVAGGAAPAAPFPQKALSRKSKSNPQQKRLPFSTSPTSTPSRIRMPGNGQ